MKTSPTHAGEPEPEVKAVGAVRSRETRRHSPATRKRGGLLLSLTAWVVGLLFATPVFWMILTSFRSETDAATNPPTIFAPLTLDGYRAFFSVGPWPSIINSLTASVFSTLLVLVLALPAAYALSIKPVKNPKGVLFFMLTTKFLPIVTSILPLYLFALYTGLLDNIWLLVFLYTTMNLPIAVWMLQSFLAEVPKEMLEAAELDGARLHLILLRVVAPVAMPGLAATALICFIFSWQELLLARSLTGTVAGTAPVFLTSFVTSQGLFLAQLSAAAFAISIPVIAAGIAAQDKLVQGLSMGAIK